MSERAMKVSEKGRGNMIDKVTGREKEENEEKKK